MTRSEISLGATEVDYKLKLLIPSMIQKSSYAVIYIPRNEVIVREDDLTCQISVTMRNLPCQLLQKSNSTYHVIRIDELCKYNFC